MTTPLTSATFLSNYNDDFTDSDHYHRILFNNGRALQARELTQMQTIIQREVERLAGFILKEGGMADTSPGSIFAGEKAVHFVKLIDSLPTGYATMVGTTVENAAGVVGIVKAAIPATGSDPATLMIAFTTSNNLQSTVTASSPRVFNAGDVLSYDTGTISGTLTVQTINTSINPATGRGSMVEVPQFNTFAGGHIIMVEAQSLVISKYSSTPTAIIGFKLVQEIVTPADDIALYDNSGSTPNLTSPGADRLKITMELVDKADVLAGETFYPLYEITRGVARAIVTRDNVLSTLGDILATRTHNITGNFIVRRSDVGTFALEVANDSDANYLQYKVDGGIAFINGHRIEVDRKNVIRVEKPRSLLDDVETKTNQFINAAYGNYLIADSAAGIVNLVEDFGTINIYNAVDKGGSVIGTARVRNLDEYADVYRIHLFDVKMDSSGGTPYSFNSARSIGTASTDYANLAKGTTADYDIYQKEDNSLLFPLDKTRVQEVSNVTMAVRKLYTDVTNASGQATFSTGSSNVFTNIEDWIVEVDSSGQLFPTPSISGTPNTSATVTGLPTNSAVTMLGYENITAVRKTKTLNSNVTISGVTTENGGTQFKLNGYHDIYRFRSVTDDTTSEDITYMWNFDNGQRDNFYTVGSGTLKGGYSPPAGTISVVFDYFQHSAGDFFAGKPSYPDVDLENIPTHTTQYGISYRLSDVIDMRPKKDDYGANFTDAGASITYLPKNSDTITATTVKYWEARMDTITVSPEGTIQVYKGPTGVKATPPANVPSSELKLHQVALGPYTLDKNDVYVNSFENLGYQMSDIDQLKRRVENLEKSVTLNAAEIQSMRSSVPDPNDATLPDRIKNGLTADGFTDNLQSLVASDDYRANISRYDGILRPMQFLRALTLQYDSDQSIGTIRKGSNVWPKYTEEVMIDQSVASKAILVNQYVTSRATGTGIIDPSFDVWQVRKLVDESYKSGSSKSYLPKGSIAAASQGDQTE